jgi:hypothetical protein
MSAHRRARRRWLRWTRGCRRWWGRSRWRKHARRLKPLWWRLGSRGPSLPSCLRRRWRHSHLDRLVWEEAGLRARAFFDLETPEQVGRLLCERAGLRPRAAGAVAVGLPATLTATEVEGLAALLSLPHGLLAALLGHRGTRALCAELHALDRRERFGRKVARMAVRDPGLACDPALARACSRVAAGIRHLPALPPREDVASLAFETLRLTVTGAEDEVPRKASWERAHEGEEPSAEVEEDWEEEDEFWDDCGDEGKGAGEGDGCGDLGRSTQALLEALGTQEEGQEGEPARTSRTIVDVRRADRQGVVGSGPPADGAPELADERPSSPPTMLFGYERHRQALQAGCLLADFLTAERGEGAFSIGFVSREGLSWAAVGMRAGRDRALAQDCWLVARQAPGLREAIW